MGTYCQNVMLCYSCQAGTAASISSICTSTMESASSSRDSETNDTSEAPRRPLYSFRQSPLVQPHVVSRFVEESWELYGREDLAHEWVVVFRSMIHSGDCQSKHQRYDKGLKLRIPDTVLFNQNGYVKAVCSPLIDGLFTLLFVRLSSQPSLWFTTSLSGVVHAKPLTVLLTSRLVDEIDSPSSTCC